MPSTILVIDNDIHVLATATDLLEVAGHRVLAAASGEQGVAMAMTVRPDLILVDRQMLMMNGFELLQQLKAGTVTSRIPVVALTSGTAQEANQRMQAGGIAFIPQPSEPAAFLRHIADILNVTVEQGRPRSDP